LTFNPLEDVSLAEPVDAIVSFSLSSEMYFMRTKVLPRKDRALVDLACDLYKLQRRDNFRLVIPKRYRARFEMRSYDLEATKAVFPVVDLSGGGLSFEMLYASDTIRSGTHVTGLLRVGESFSKPIVAVVRHVRPFGSMGSGLFRCGIQFEEIPAAESEEIIQLVMKIHRESFSKF
jgi:c-di-GMP-binding flagellar brake protein YcgR